MQTYKLKNLNRLYYDWVEFTKVWNDSSSVAEVRERLNVSSGIATRRAYLLRHSGVKIKKMLPPREHFVRIGAIGGRNGHTGGFAANPELARIAGAKGGRTSRRTK